MRRRHSLCGGAWWCPPEGRHQASRPPGADGEAPARRPEWWLHPQGRSSLHGRCRPLRCRSCIQVFSGRLQPRCSKDLVDPDPRLADRRGRRTLCERRGSKFSLLNRRDLNCQLPTCGTPSSRAPGLSFRFRRRLRMSTFTQLPRSGTPWSRRLGRPRYITQADKAASRPIANVLQSVLCGSSFFVSFQVCQSAGLFPCVRVSFCCTACGTLPNENSAMRVCSALASCRPLSDPICRHDAPMSASTIV